MDFGTRLKAVIDGMSDYISPGMNALNWLKDKAVDPVIEKTFEPEFLKTIDHINNVFDIEWGGNVFTIGASRDDGDMCNGHS